MIPDWIIIGSEEGTTKLRFKEIYMKLKKAKTQLICMDEIVNLVLHMIHRYRVNVLNSMIH